MTKSSLILLTILLTAWCCTLVSATSPDDYIECEDQLDKYRKFILQAILSVEDVCEAYASSDAAPHEFIRNYNPQQRTEIWAFFKLLMAQFNDVEFVSVIKDAVLQRCQAKTQRDEKRNSVVLGKKQRFHSWGGKRAVFGTHSIE